MAKRNARATLGLAVLLTLVGCGSDEHEDFESLSEALSRASAGDTVRVGPARISGGTLRIPPGVTLAGDGVSSTIVVAPTDSVGIIMNTGEGETRLTGLTVESDGRAGVLVVGSGAASVENVSVEAGTGAAMAAEDAARLTMTDVRLSGPVTRDNAVSMPPRPTPDMFATHGLVLLNIANAQLERVHVDGFASLGALFVNSTVSWNGGGAEGNLGTGMMSLDGSTTLDSVQICGGLEGVSLIPSYGAVFASNSVVDSSAFTICDGEGYGTLQSQSRAAHANLIATGNAHAAVWLQDSPDGMSMSGTGTRIANNAFAGIVLMESANVDISDAMIQSTQEVLRLDGEVGMIRIGDGIQLVSPAGNVNVRNVSLDRNERIGLLLDLGGSSSTSGVTLDGVAIRGEGDAYGAVAQNGTVEMGWDDGVTRVGATAANDAAVAELLLVGGVVAPTDLPSAANLETMGLEAIGVVAPTD